MKIKHAPHFLFVFSALAALPLLLSACAEPDDGVIVEIAPPADEVEVSPTINNPASEIWRSGYWSIGKEGGFVWIPGKIIPRPAPTAVWASARWVHHTYGWSFEQGHWQ